MILHAYVDVYVLCVCIVDHGHGGDYTTLFLNFSRQRMPTSQRMFDAFFSNAYIYIYIYRERERDERERGLHFIVKTSFIHSFSFDTFKLTYGCFYIRPKLANKPSVINWFPSTFGLPMGHYQGGAGCWMYITNAIQSLQLHYNFV